MPSLNFVMPHWLYWAGLILFPLIAIYLVPRQERRPPDRRPSLFIAYLFWLLSGFLGIHRFYLRSSWGALFIPVFLGIVYCNGQIRDVRDEESRTFAAMEQAQYALERARPQQGAEATPEAKQTLEQAEADLRKIDAEYRTAKAVRDRWKSIASWLAILLATMLVIDGVLLPGLVRRRHALETANPDAEIAHPEAPQIHEAGTGEDPTLAVHTRFTDVIETVNVKVGQYVAWWALISVFVYYYEVVARFVFNSPTNWVHESMFLMYGMQYMLCGAFAYREDQHVRVDVIYTKFSPRGKAIADIITSFFFFIFIGTLAWTSGRFALDSIQVNEHSFTEWGIQYWPVKLSMPIGSALLLLQGVSKLIKDVTLVMRRGA
jgi:TRAP-type mannitol/chloroaromatic compound transport system permease small subunit/exonuclease VII small subunit